MFHRVQETGIRGRGSVLFSCSLTGKELRWARTGVFPDLFTVLTSPASGCASSKEGTGIWECGNLCLSYLDLDFSEVSGPKPPPSSPVATRITKAMCLTGSGQPSLGDQGNLGKTRVEGNLVCTVKLLGYYPFPFPLPFSSLFPPPSLPLPSTFPSLSSFNCGGDQCLRLGNELRGVAPPAALFLYKKSATADKKRQS